LNSHPNTYLLGDAKFDGLGAEVTIITLKNGKENMKKRPDRLLSQSGLSCHWGMNGVGASCLGTFAGCTPRFAGYAFRERISDRRP
jgi:hypothetical protein